MITSDVDSAEGQDSHPGARGSIPVNSGGLRAKVAVRLYDRNIQRVLINIVVILVIATIVHLITGKVFTFRNISALSVQIAVVVIIACPMTLVMVAGFIDVSVSGVVVLSGVIAGVLLVDGWPVGLAFGAAVAAGVAIGLINTFLVMSVNIPAFIATIGTLYACQGAANLVTNGLPVGGVPSWFGVVGSGTSFGIPNPAWIMVFVVALFVGIQRYTRLGRYAIAIGSDKQAAFLNGVNVYRTAAKCFILSGAAAGWGGVMYASRIGNPSPTLDQDLLFQVIVAIVVGGASLQGGAGSVMGTFTGAILIGIVNQSLNLLGVPSFWQYIALGVLLVLSVGSDEIMRGEHARELRRSLSNRRGRNASATPAGS